MNKFLAIAFCVLGFSAASRASDSMALFPAANGLVIMVNEVGQGKVAQIFNALALPGAVTVDWSSNGDSTSDVEVSCKRGVHTNPNTTPYSCTFHFSPSKNVQIMGNSMSAKIGDVTTNLLVDVAFVNATNDTFIFKFMSKGLVASSVKSPVANSLHMNLLADPLNDALKCASDETAWITCSEYKPADQQKTWVRLCQKPASPNSQDIIPAMIVARKITETQFAIDRAEYSSFEENVGIHFQTAHKAPEEGQKVKYFEYSFSPAQGKPYTHLAGELLHTVTKSGGAVADVGVRTNEYELSCWTNLI